jgi:hypothetical protein
MLGGLVLFPYFRSIVGAAPWGVCEVNVQFKLNSIMKKRGLLPLSLVS